VLVRSVLAVTLHLLVLAAAALIVLAVYLIRQR
jgi:hypothetical protein